MIIKVVFEDNLKNEDGFKNEDNLRNKDGLKKEYYLNMNTTPELRITTNCRGSEINTP